MAAPAPQDGRSNCLNSDFHNECDHSTRKNQDADTETSVLVRPPGRTYHTAPASERNPAKSKMTFKEWKKDVNLVVYVLVWIFAWSSWLDVNGLWVEVPLLVNELPESWNLPSYLVIIIQIANLGPLLYTIANRLAPNKVKEWPVVYIIIFIGAAGCLLLSFFWKRTSVIAGSEHSTALLVLTGFLSLVDCTSSVVYLPYMAAFKPQYMTAFYFGEGLGGLIPGLVGLIQGVGSDPTCVNNTVITYNSTTGLNETEFVVYPEYAPPRFSVEVFFYFLCALVCASAVAFSVLHFSSFCNQEKIIRSIPQASADYSAQSEISSVSQDKLALESSSQVPIHPVKVSRDDDGKNPLARQLSRGEFAILLVLIALCNGLTNGVIPSTQSYTCLPYGNLVYTLAVRLSAVANPLACLLALFVSTKSISLLGVLTLVGSILTGFQIYLAAMSPAPPLQGTAGGSAIVILSSILLTACFSYTKVAIASLAMGANGRWGLLWVGGVTQIGSFTGAIITFILVNVERVFVSMPPC